MYEGSKKIIYLVTSLAMDNGESMLASRMFLSMAESKPGLEAAFIVVHDRGATEMEKILRERGCPIVYLPSLKRPLAVSRVLRKKLAGGRYDIIHCHVPNVGAIALFWAKREGIPVRILTVHASRAGEIWWKRLLSDALKEWTCKNATYFFAVSELAGKAVLKKRPFEVLPVAVETEKYDFDPLLRKEIRKKYGLEEDIPVLGTVGRIVRQKNPAFMVALAAAAVGQDPRVKFLWVGDGAEREHAEELVRKAGIADAVIFVGRGPAVPYLQAMDAFLLPSLYEGLPTVGIEAQIAGLPVLIADTITMEAAVTDLAQYLSLGDPPAAWARRALAALKDDRRGRRAEIAGTCFDLKTASATLGSRYFELLRGE